MFKLNKFFTCGFRNGFSGLLLPGVRGLVLFPMVYGLLQSRKSNEETLAAANLLQNENL